MLLWKPAKKKKTAHAKKEPPKPYTPPDIPKFVQQSEKTKAKEEKRVPPEKAFMDTFRQLTSRHRSIDIWRDFVVMSACSFSNAVDKTPLHYPKRENNKEVSSGGTKVISRTTRPPRHGHGGKSRTGFPWGALYDA